MTDPQTAITKTAIELYLAAPTVTRARLPDIAGIPPETVACVACGRSCADGIWLSVNRIFGLAEVRAPLCQRCASY